MNMKDMSNFRSRPKLIRHRTGRIPASIFTVLTENRITILCFSVDSLIDLANPQSPVPDPLLRVHIYGSALLINWKGLRVI